MRRSELLINLDAIAQNTTAIKKTLSPATKLMAVVKADGYGHGSVETAKAALGAGADFLGVATAEEGLTIREALPLAKILILGAVFDEQLEDCLRLNIGHTVFDLDSARKLSEISVKLGVLSPIHIKIDTGMSRIGFSREKSAVAEIKQVMELPGLFTEGIYSHLADSDNNDSSFSLEQARRFAKTLEAIGENALKPGILKHISNSGATLLLPQLNFDMVRTGILLYGLFPRSDVNLREMGIIPALSFKSSVTQVKTVLPGETVGYGRTFLAERKTVIATIPIGYADGYPRLCSNRGRVLIKGEYAPIVGNICMDQMMADVTGIKGVCTGDEVTLIGVQNKNEITACEVAENADTICYEIICGLGKRSLKKYICENPVVL